MAENCGCGCGVRLVAACSGCSDVGEIADQVARRLSKENIAKMTCLAGIGAHISGYTASAKGANTFITVDGCGVACAKKILEHIEVSPKSYILTDMGFEKGKTAVTNENLDKASSFLIDELRCKQ